MISRDEYGRRIAAACETMDALAVDVLALSASSDMAYLCGYRAMPLERLTLLVIGQWGEPTLLVPELEEPRVDSLDGLFTVRTWADGQDMIAAAASEVRKAASPRPSVAVADTMWAGVLLPLQAKLPHARWLVASQVTRRLRVRKSPREVELLRAAAVAIDSVVGSLPELAWVGRSEADIAAEVSALVTDAGHESVNFAIVASGSNGASPHHDPGERRVAPGDAVVVDIGGRMQGYCSDITRVVCVGEPSAEVSRAWSALRSAQEAAVASVRPGVRAEEVDAVARDSLTSDGLGEYFIHRTGHGIGLDEHEAPYIVAGSAEVLEGGMCFSVEPGVYVPGKFGLRLEDIVCCTDSGVEPLNTLPHDLVVVEV